MPKKIQRPTVIQAAGNKPKSIEEFFGRVNSETSEVSIARMKSPQGWEEPWQTPEFNEYTVLLKGALQVETQSGLLTVEAGQAILIQSGERVRYSTPQPGGAEYMAVCLPAFSPETVNREQI